MIEVQDIITVKEDRLQDVYYNNPLFYCFAHKNFYPPEVTYNIPEHWHEDIEFLYVSSGEMEYNVNGQKLHLSAGEGICIPPRKIHANRSPRGTSCAFYCVILHPSYLKVSPYIEKTYVNQLLGPGAFDYLLLRHDDWTKEIIDMLLELFESEDTKEFELGILEAAFRFLKILSRNMAENTQYEAASSVYSTTFMQMVSYINDNYMNKIALEEIANAGNVGKTLCAKIFRKFTGKTPGDYLIHYRITQSMKLLTDSEMSITDIAYSTGFNSASYYTKTFRLLIGCTPNKYRSAPQNIAAFSSHY